MSAFQHGAGFRICGAVVRRFVNAKGNFAILTLDVNGHPKSKKIELRCFDKAIVEEIRQLGAGETVEVTGSVDAEGLRDKQGNDVKVDGYVKWVFPLTARAIKVEGSSRRPSAPAEPPADGSAAPPPPADQRRKGWDDSDPGADRFDKAGVNF